MLTATRLGTKSTGCDIAGASRANTFLPAYAPFFRATRTVCLHRLKHMGLTVLTEILKMKRLPQKNGVLMVWWV
jgi:hypothetical protein